MSIILTEKFADKVDERFTPMAITAAVVNQDYDFVGAKTVKVTSIQTVPAADYSRTAGYGAAAPLSNKIQELTMEQDRSFKILLDKMDEEESKIKAGMVLARQMKEVVIPEIEAYRLGKMLDSCVANSLVTTAASPYKDFLKMQEQLDDAYIPASGRVLLVTPAYLNELKTDDDFIKASDIAQGMLINGQVGTIDGVPVIKANKTWLVDSAATNFKAMLVHKSATVAPIKLSEFKTITDSEQYSGTLFLGRYYYDAFVLDTKKLGLVALK